MNPLPTPDPALTATDARIATLAEEHRTSHAVERLAREIEALRVEVAGMRGEQLAHIEAEKPVLEIYRREREAEDKARAEGRARLVAEGALADVRAEADRRKAAATFWKIVAIVGAILSLAVAPALSRLTDQLYPDEERHDH